MATKAKAAKTAGASGEAQSFALSRSRFNADLGLAAALRSRAADMAKNEDHATQQAARIVEWAATDDGNDLRGWMVEFRDCQAAALTWEQVSAEVPLGSSRQYTAALDSALKRWESEVVSDGCGKPAEIDVVEYIDALAYRIASTKPPTPWERMGSDERDKHLKSVRTKARELASLLEDPDGPRWPSAIELFDQAHRPILRDFSLNEYRAQVADRLKGQQIPKLLNNLAEQAERQARMDAIVQRSRGAPRPNTVGAFNRLLAREICGWFETRCLRTASNALIASLMNARWRQAAQSNTELVTEEQVKEWLRSPRGRGAAKASD